VPITKDDILHVAALARLELDPAELERLTSDLTQILSYVEQIKLVNTENIVPQSQFIKAENVFREDVVRPSLSQEEALANAPDHDKEYFLVPRVLG
jgi:aspartyl-tRNA(Asn)/glutamyl-tRNA(Gln) amidotransferase subunit C